jgi:two-component system response regulator HydG
LGIADRDPERRLLLSHGLEERGFDVRTWPSASVAVESLDRLPPHSLLLCECGPSAAAKASEGVRSLRPDIALVLLTRPAAAREVAAAAPGAGLVIWPTGLDDIAALLERAQRRHADLRRTEARAAVLAEELMGDSPVMQQLRETVARIADSDATVLISGETGTGKELVARAVHRASSRRDRPFIAVNCAAVPAQLLESELFGSTTGAFTGARASRIGLFRAATSGTLLLDELSELPLELQPKLLRALHSRTVRPVGSVKEDPFDARVICTTNMPLSAAVRERRFRSDLFFRVSTIHLDLPPLRDRGADDVLLARAFMKTEAAKADKRVDGFSESALQRLRAYAWPGNVRELRNAIEHAVAFTTSSMISEIDLPDAIRDDLGTGTPLGVDEGLPTLAEIERRHIVRVLLACGGSPANAARVLGVSPLALKRKLLRHGVRPDGTLRR